MIFESLQDLVEFIIPESLHFIVQSGETEPGNSGRSFLIEYIHKFKEQPVWTAEAQSAKKSEELEKKNTNSIPKKKPHIIVNNDFSKLEAKMDRFISLLATLIATQHRDAKDSSYDNLKNSKI